MLGQNGIQDASKGIKVSISGGQLVGNGFNNADIKTIGSPFFHENWIPTLFKEKKISVKYDAFNSQMITSSGQMLIPFDGISLKLENGETWLTFNKKWYKLINQKNDFYNSRLERVKMINRRSDFNQFAFHLSNPIMIFFRNIFLKLLTKNKKFLQSYLGKIYKD